MVVQFDYLQVTTLLGENFLNVIPCYLIIHDIRFGFIPLPVFQITLCMLYKCCDHLDSQ